MPTRELPRRPDLDQYRKQAKELVRFRRIANPASGSDARNLTRLFKLIQQYHPKFRHKPEAEISTVPFTLSDAQLIIAREHGFASWPQFAHEIEARRSSVEAQENPEKAFLRAACVPRDDWHVSGTIDAAEAILKQRSEVANSSIYCAAVLGDDKAIGKFLQGDPPSATTRGGVYAWDPLTYLCFSRYLRVYRKDQTRAEAFARTARLLLEAGASADTGWFESNNEPVPFWEPAIYGAAGIAQHAEVTQVLLEYGADPNDEETPYHVAETRDLTVLKVLLESGKLNERSKTTLLLRKADWHDLEGMKMLFGHGADAHRGTTGGIQR